VPSIQWSPMLIMIKDKLDKGTPLRFDLASYVEALPAQGPLQGHYVRGCL
jgi:hypothetical protein